MSFEGFIILEIFNLLIKYRTRQTKIYLKNPMTKLEKKLKKYKEILEKKFKVSTVSKRHNLTGSETLYVNQSLFY